MSQSESNNIVFHAGALFTRGSNGSPRRLMTVQETSFDFKGDTKKLMGENQFPVDAATGTVDISVKAKSGQLDPEAVNDMFFDKEVSAGAMVMVEGELGSVKDGKYTVVAAADFAENLGVRDADSGRYLTLATGLQLPAAGQYKVDEASGEFRFHTSQEGKQVLIDYLRDDNTGKKILVTNEIAGATVNFRAIFTKSYRDRRLLTLICPRCICSSTAFGFKQNDYVMPDFEFSVAADDRGIPFEWHWSTVAA